MKIFKIVTFLLCSFFYVLCTDSTRAANEFIIDSKIEYKVGETGVTTVAHNITLENEFTEYYATSYGLTLENIEPSNIQAYDQNGTPYKVEIQKEGEKTNINVTFPDAMVGKGKSRNFTVRYDNTSFAVKTGEVWEVVIPKLSDESNFRSYRVILKIPLSFGDEAYMSPNPETSKEENGFKNYEFNKESLTKTGVSAAFGQFQVFNFTLNYHLENPLTKSAETEIAIPPDTAFQKVYARSLSPEPKNVRVDEDGNWLAVYELTGRQRLDVVASGEVQIFASYRRFPVPTKEILDSNLLATEYWQVGSPEIQKLARELKTPRAIYDFVSGTLKYDYGRVKPNVDRLGALNALKSPHSAICMEFTDLFIALARAAGIPAREVNGFAYTENPEIQPLGLVSDVLHAWPEYWDSEKNVWIPVDPTWGATTGGENFFDKLDLRHFTFVMHGKSDTKPYAPGSYKLGANPQKDVFVYFGKLAPETPLYPTIEANFKNSLSFFNSQLLINIKNQSSTAYYDLIPKVFFDNKLSKEDIIEILPPYGVYRKTIKIPFSLLGHDTPNIIRVEVNGQSVEVATNKNQVIISSLLIIFLIFIIVIVYLIIKLKWIKKFSNLPQKVREFIYSKLVKNQSI